MIDRSFIGKLVKVTILSDRSVRYGVVVDPDEVQEANTERLRVANKQHPADSKYWSHWATTRERAVELFEAIREEHLDWTIEPYINKVRFYWCDEVSVEEAPIA